MKGGAEHAADGFCPSHRTAEAINTRATEEARIAAFQIRTSSDRCIRSSHQAKGLRVEGGEWRVDEEVEEEVVFKISSF